MSCLMDRLGGGGGEEMEDECEPKPVLSFAEAHTTFQTMKSFFMSMMRTFRVWKGCCLVSTKQLPVKVWGGGADK
jgi:hypothetical protein